jgi:FkbM family methyltransferase
MGIEEISIQDYERLNPNMQIDFAGHTLRYNTPNSATVWRVETLSTKEPVTLEWIAGFETGSVMVDVGANVGMYTIAAAVARHVQVFAFEPESQNFALLNKNIVLNEVHSLVRAWPAALSDRAELGVLHISSFDIGGSCHSFGEPVDFNLQQQKFPYAQGAISLTLDQAVASAMVPVPNYIKIDVDGFEHKVVAGARETLTDKRVKSLLIEVNPSLSEHQGLIAELDALGFIFDPEQVQRATRTEGAFKGVGEHLFYRRGAQS